MHIVKDNVVHTPLQSMTTSQHPSPLYHQKAEWWRMYAALGLYSGCPYDDIFDSPECRDHGLPLDEIRVARQARIPVIKRMAAAAGHQFTIQAIGWLSNVADIWRDGHSPDATGGIKSTEVRYQEHLNDLVKAGVILQHSPAHQVV
jgi:hypothetical protein